MVYQKKMAVVLAACCLAVTACSGAKENGGESGQPDKSAPNPAASIKSIEDTPVVLTITQAGATEEAFEKHYGEMIRKRFPNFTIKWITTTAANFADTVFTASTPIDLMFTSTSNIPTYLLDYRLQSDINDLIKKYNYNVTNLQAEAIDVQRKLSNGAIYGFPIYTGTLVYLY
ncbi:MAG: hypothetical protein K0Q59_2987, partial [Paenibacillus sp.]|nr:hypothetical protein [Paenibacillus sp.]